MSHEQQLTLVGILAVWAIFGTPVALWHWWHFRNDPEIGGVKAALWSGLFWFYYGPTIFACYAYAEEEKAWERKFEQIRERLLFDEGKAYNEEIEDLGEYNKIKKTLLDSKRQESEK